MSNLTARDKQFFYGQLLTALKARLPLGRAAALLAKHYPAPNLTNLLETLEAALREGLSLSSFMRRHPQEFTSYEGDLIEVGESSGNLIGSLEWLAELFRQENEAGRRSRLQSWYLGMAAGVGLVVIAALNLAVIPIFKRMFQDMGGMLPSLTRLAFGVSDLMVQYWVLVLVLMALAAAGVWWVRRRYPELFSLMVTQIPWIGSAWITRESFGFAWILGRALQAGVAPRQALEGAAEFVRHPHLKARLRTMGAFLEGGRAWATALESIRGFPRSIIAFVQLGEDQGELGLALLEVSRSESKEFLEGERWVEGLMMGMVVFLALVVGMEAIAMYLPIFNMMSIIS